MEFKEATVEFDELTKELIFETDGYHYFTNETWEDVDAEIEFLYRKEKIGIGMRVPSEKNFLYLHIYNEGTKGTLEIGNQIGDNETGRTNLIEKKEVPLLIEEDKYNIRVRIAGSRYLIFLNEKLIHEMWNPYFHNGKMAAYAVAGNAVKKLKLSSSYPLEWKSNSLEVSGVVVRSTKEDGVPTLILVGTELDDAEASKIIKPVVAGKHTLSFSLHGKCSVRIVNPATSAEILSTTLISDKYTKQSIQITIPTGWTQIELIMTSDEHGGKIQYLQLEQLEYDSSYIPTKPGEQKERLGSFITYPGIEDLSMEKGTCSVWVKFNQASNAEKVVFSYGTGLQLSHKDDAFVFKYGKETVSIPKPIKTKEDASQWINIYTVWSKNRIAICVDGSYIDRKQSFLTPFKDGIFAIGHKDKKNVFVGGIDELILLEDSLEEKTITSLRENSNINERPDIVFHATFNYAITNFEQSTVDIPMSPNDFSPVLVEKNGKQMKRVSFFDYETGKYQTRNKEVFVFDKNTDFIELAHTDIDNPHFPLVIKDEGNVIYGSPYMVDGGRVYLSLTENEKDLLDGRILYAYYQPIDCFTVDYNIKAWDSFQVDIGKHDGQKTKITYEGNRFSDKKLASMIELNPLINPNSEGFLYITKNVEKVSDFKIHVKDSSVYADGMKTMICIEPFDKNGNFLSHVKLDVSCKHGKLQPMLDIASIVARESAGRFWYEYTSPLISQESVKKITMKEIISCIDKETGLGMQTSITLRLLSNRTAAKKIIPYGVVPSHPNPMDYVRPKSRTFDDVIEGLLPYINKTNAPVELLELYDKDNDGIIGYEDIVHLQKSKYK